MIGSLFSQASYRSGVAMNGPVPTTTGVSSSNTPGQSNARYEVAMLPTLCSGSKDMPSILAYAAALGSPVSRS